MSRFAAFWLLACAVLCFAQASQIPVDSTVYIEPGHDFEGFLAAAILKLHVPLNVVAEESKADYIIKSTVSSEPNVRYSPWSRGASETNVSISIVDRQSKQIVFAYAVGNANTNQLKTAAEACAKKLKAAMGKPKK